MMRGPDSMVIAVRAPDGSIVVKDDKWVPIIKRYPILKLPFVRGAIVLIESMVNGMQALSFSASVAMDEEAEQAARDAEAAGATAEEVDKAREDAKPSETLTAGAIAVSLASAMALGAALFIYLPHAGATFLTNVFNGLPLTTEAPVASPTFHAIVGLIKMLVFVSYILLIRRMPDIKRVFQYHGAEHKSIHAYEAGQELTVENAKSWPTFHPRCGTSFLVFVILISIFFFAGVFPLVPFPPDLAGWKLNLLQASIKIPMMVPIAGIGYEFIKFAGKLDKGSKLMRWISWPGWAMQQLTTIEPDDEQLEVALTSLKRALEHEGALEPTYENVRFLAPANAAAAVAVEV
ncbi:MAG: DUF1385 domain-containing protein [Deltaproteobacteria bacterium]|nr:DUF1385 domain-containing protein [Deltaproteobacteria bacterium]